MTPEPRLSEPTVPATNKPLHLRVWRRWWPSIVGAAVYLFLCVLKSGPIGLITGHRWQTWWDQSKYLQSTLSLLHGDLAPAHHWYPLVYSALAVPFAPILPLNPFLPLDILCVALLTQSVTRVAARLGIGPGAALIILLLTVLWPPELWHAWVQPWTTTLSAALIWWLMAEAGDLSVGGDVATPRRAALLGLGGMLIPLVRPADAVLILILGGYIAFALLKRRLLDLRLFFCALVSASTALFLYGLLHLAIYGPALTDYMRISGEIGLSFTDLGWRASVLFIDPAPWFPGGKAMLGRMPWIALGLAGAMFLLIRRDQAITGRRAFAACLLLASAAYTIILTAYGDLLPSGLWLFNNIHYFKWMFPLLGMTAWLLIREGRQAPRRAVAAIAAVLLVTGLHVTAVPANPDELARRLDFATPRDFAHSRAEPPDKKWLQIYFASSVIMDGGRPRRNVFDYHQIADGRTVRAVALGNDFTPQTRWYGAGVPGTDPGIRVGAAPLPGSWPSTPIARWKKRLRWDPPCWLFGCTTG